MTRRTTGEDHPRRKPFSGAEGVNSVTYHPFASFQNILLNVILEPLMVTVPITQE